MEFTIILLNVKKILIVYSNYFKGAKKGGYSTNPFATVCGSDYSNS